MALVSLSENDSSALRAGASRDVIHAELLELYQKVNAKLDPHEKIKTIVVTRGDWTIENGIMTPTLKIKRNVLESRYEDRIENWYESSEKVQWE
jgi:long-chain acyl-CoA synthetase